MNNYFELQIKINPDLEDVVSEFCFEMLPCEGVVLAEEAYKDLEMISTTEGTLKVFLTEEPKNLSDILKQERELLKSRGLSDEELGSWEYVISNKPNEDWSKKWKEKWDITRVTDKIVIVPDWLDYSPKADEVVIRLEPGCAFGTGTHQTTQLCMKAIEKYMQKGAKVADIGMGSGILAICAKKFGASYAYGCDNDETVIDVAKENAIKNSAECTFELNTADKVNEKFDLDKSQIEKYNPNIDEGEIKVFDEIKVLKNILENASEMKEFFANSYFIEASKNKNNNDIKYISFNNCRKEEYQLMTIIKDDVVEKLPTNAKAQKQIENMGKIIKNIKNENIEILDYEENSKIYSKLVKNEKTLDRMLARKYNNIEELIQILNEYKNVLLQNSKSYSECKEKINIDGNEEQLEQLNYLKNGYWDLIPKNCFYINQKFVFFDQEWEKDYLPVEFILYRAIINSYDLVRKINVEELLKEINILQYKELFEKLDEKIRDEIIDNKVHEAMYKKYDLKAIDNLINDNKAYYEENSRKDEYIKKLEKYVEELKLDNTKKQEYIEILEEKLSKKKKRFF